MEAQNLSASCWANFEQPIRQLTRKSCPWKYQVDILNVCSIHGSRHLVLIVGFVSSSTASTLLRSPVVASAVVAVAVVVVVSKASLPSLSQLTPKAKDQCPCLLILISSYLLPIGLRFGLLWPLFL